MALDLETICPDSALINEVGLAKLQRAGFTEDQRTQYRTKALDDFKDALTDRSPPIFESDVATPTQLT